MGAVIESIRRATNEEWDRMVDADKTAVYFQTREWFDIWAEYAGFENDTKHITFRNQKKVLLPLARINLLKGLVKAHVLSPKGMGGFVTSATLNAEEKDGLFDFLRQINMLYCAVNPYDQVTNDFDQFTAQDFTQVLDLSPGFDSLVRTWSKGHYSAAKKGMRDGITVELAVTEGDWKSYFELYQDSLDRWGEKATNTYQWKLFETMYRKNSSGIKLWLARYQGQIISGAICLYHNKNVAYWHSAISKHFFKKLNANHVLQYYIMKNACERDFLLYDLLPSSGIEGVINFKNGFSPQRRPVHIYMSQLMKLSNAARNRLRNNAVYRLLMKNSGF